MGDDVVKHNFLTPFFSKKSDQRIYFPGKEETYVKPEILKSIILSTNPLEFLWNGLACGEAYLNPLEYYQLRDFIKTTSVEGIFEFGAGYCSVLFKKLVKQVISIEAFKDSWSDYALKQDCDVRFVPFDQSSGFDIDQYKNIVKEFKRLDLVFLDSPTGTANRLKAAKQIVELIPHAKFYVIHDSIRDAEVVYYLLNKLGLKLVKHFGSFRGLTFLAKGNYNFERLTKERQINSETASQIKFKVTVKNIEYRKELKCVFLKIALKNIGSEIIPFTGAQKLHFSYHIIGNDNSILVWDTPRYELAVDLEPQDEVVFNLKLNELPQEDCILHFDLVCEGKFWWSSLTNETCPEFDLITANV